MSKYQKALDNVKIAPSFMGGNDEYRRHLDSSVPFLKDIAVLQELVDKETPMKVEYFKDDKTLEIYNAQCPTCKYIFGYDFIPINELGKKYRQHCPRCGKKIKWGDECE